ncbi:MAG TPA: hypothetical protein PKM73_08300 [Verrucomicrobiota bacterium]|nr:hypothetical protein [Verrucomicrobiota bacterium]HNU49548.1 hypothetical protein [Verrucomicrobiota bacterium]
MNRAFAAGFSIVLAAAVTAAAAVGPEVALIAHWTFDDPESSLVLRDSAGRGGLDAQADRPVPQIRGVDGLALHLRGSHALRIGGSFGDAALAAITFSAWVKPGDLGGFREIFRQECACRLLFSFQENGTILSLGLNIGGYVECDAPVDPGKLRDGLWHHCAASFDGQSMRVFLDGTEIRALARPGRIAIDPGAPAFLGSSSGVSEHFQGGLDDVRIYAGALDPTRIAALFQAGDTARQQLARELEALLATVYQPAPAFAETIVRSRTKFHEVNPAWATDLVPPIEARLRATFPKESSRFLEATGLSPAAYIGSNETGLERRLVGRVIELLDEYRPLTPAQWQRQSAADRRRWAEIEALRNRLEPWAPDADSADPASPEWIRSLLEAAAHIQHRPRLHEPVAPFVRPETPAATTRSAEEGRAALERDWLHQAGNAPTPDRIQKEIGWTRDLARRIQACATAPDLDGDLRELDRLNQAAQDLTQPDPQLYFKVRALKRRIAFRNPVVDFDQVLLVDSPFPQGSEWRHETRHRLGYMAVPGGRLLVLDGLRPDGRVRQLAPEAPLHGAFWRPDLAYDARTVLFCFKPHNEKSFHLYEIGVDGSGLRQLTDGPYDDLDPIYLPDDRHVLFSTTRGHTYVRCMPPTSSFVLGRCDRDGRNLYIVSANNEPDYLPSIMPDGRVLYTRWEYTDKPLWRAQKLWTMNPDGTQVTMFWGNQSVWPDLVKDARVIPGSRRVMFTGSAHHDWFAGSVGIIDPDRGFNFPDGLTKVTADVPWPECGNGPVDPVESPAYHESGLFPAYYSPYPLGDRDFLVSAERQGRFVLYLMDVEGNRELIFEGAHHVFHAQPLRPRPRPTVIADRVVWPMAGAAEDAQDGVLFSSSVYQGAPAELQGKARFLRVFSIDHKTYTYWYKRPYISTGPVVSTVQSEGVKRLLGTVPIEPDGSVSFRAPAGLPLHFQLLDERQRALHTMRSFANVMPGEYRGCLGCHESHSRTAPVEPTALALRRPPHEITPPPWTDTTVSYPRYVQPVLDRYCGQCHQGDGEARETLDLTLRPGEPVFPEPYHTLIGRPTWGQPYQRVEPAPPGFGIAGCLLVEAYSTVDPQAYVTPKPMSSLSYRSRLIDWVSSGEHHGIRVDDVSLLRLIVWVDAMCPYLGDEEIRAIPDPVFQGVDWLAVRPRVATAPRILRPGPLDPP